MLTTTDLCVCITTRERIFLDSCVFIGLKGQCPIIYSRILRTLTVVLRDRTRQPVQLNAQALEKEKAEEEVGSIATVKALSECESGK